MDAGCFGSRSAQSLWLETSHSWLPGDCGFSHKLLHPVSPRACYQQGASPSWKLPQTVRDHCRAKARAQEGVMRYVHHCNAAKRGRTPERTWSDCCNALTEKGYAAVSWLAALIGYCLTAFTWQTTDDTGMTFANVFESRVRLHSKDFTEIHPRRLYVSSPVPCINWNKHKDRTLVLSSLWALYIKRQRDISQLGHATVSILPSN